MERTAINQESEMYDEVFVIQVDPQVDFCEGGALGVDGGAAIMTPLNALRAWAFNEDGVRRDGIATVFTSRDWHPPETAHFENWPPHCIAGTVGAEFHPELETDGSIIVSKGTGTVDDGYSALEAEDASGRSVETYLRKSTAEKIAVVVCGLATDYCDKATVMSIQDMQDSRIDTYLVTDAIAAVNIEPGDGDRAIEEMVVAGAIPTTVKDITSGQIQFI